VLEFGSRVRFIIQHELFLLIYKYLYTYSRPKKLDVWKNKCCPVYVNITKHVLAYDR